jgi:hypothetical protein
MSLLLSSQLIRSVVSSLTHLDDPKAPSPVTNIPKRSNGRRRATGA